jgi:DIE2/ALG10 family
LQQTAKYCQGRFGEWDPKITTFPGLYLVALPYVQLLLLGSRAIGLPLVSLHSLCQAGPLRSINVLFGCLLPLLLYGIYRHLHPRQPQSVAIAMVGTTREAAPVSTLSSESKTFLTFLFRQPGRRTSYNSYS